MYSSSFLSGVLAFIYLCRFVMADVCSYVATKDCAFLPGNPLCGTNGITYRNDCFLAKAYCLDNSIHKAQDGACPGDPLTTASPPTTKALPTAATSDPLSVLCGTMNLVHCSNDIEPVCGSDDRTYINSCEFHKEVCQRHELTVKHLGFC